MKKNNNSYLYWLIESLILIFVLFVLIQISSLKKSNKLLNEQINNINNNIETNFNSLKESLNSKIKNNNVTYYLYTEPKEETNIETKVEVEEELETEEIITIESFDCTYISVYNNYDIEYAEYELDELAALVYLEARGESEEGQQAVAEVVLNRVLDVDFPNTIHDVIYDTEFGVQFTPYEEVAYTTPTEIQYEVINRALYGNLILEKDVVYFATTALNNNVYAVIGNHVFCRK